MKIFDCHLHIEKGLHTYDLKVDGWNIIFNYIESYIKFNDQFRDSHATITLILDFKENLKFIQKEIFSSRINALKVHSRIQELNKAGHIELIRVLKDIPNDITIIYDAFYFGKEFQCQPNLGMLILMVQELPDRKFIVAHAGGYEILKYFFHLREFQNV